MARAALAALCLALVLFWSGVASCGTPPGRGLYLALKFTYYEGTLEPAAAALASERFDVVYPELGVFNPAHRSFTDFIRSFEAVIGREGPGDARLIASLATLPGRLRTTFGTKVIRIPWIYLNRKPYPEDGPAGVASAHAQRSPEFDLHDEAHRQALIDAVRLLASLGFDGVHLDLEPFPAADVPAMNTLLEALRQATPPGFTRSVFTPKYVRPQDRDVHPGFVWTSTAPFQALIPHCDQLVVPLYDYGPLGRDDHAYRQRIREAVTDLLPVLEPSDRLWFGVPAYRLTAQHSSSESMSNVRAVLEQARRSPAGFAVFSYTGEPVDYVPGDVSGP